MTRKSKELYVRAINLVKNYCQENFGRQPHPLRFMADYELALMGAVCECFPGCKVRGCWFHACQVIAV